ncbi:hypothetical protein EV644_117137 [Kribbella orskensis]|uniref:Uncharacterized protein n=1 Tax=Kribbella orskensis TaxID=2512216 RepID=A0ABY2BEM3_9ACTN|nr:MULTISPECIES: hypothetical protein [Kribbella]TCN35116.1 hypothetical protein EV642_118137 [Kribbella sp. VKM Ac-2500]TCO16483.1 hypothetical protein EV644_117137 [Kribbella orskensis]
MDKGADVNFTDSSEANSWNVPVLRDAIRAAVFSARFGRNMALAGEPPDIEIMSTSEQFDTDKGWGDARTGDRLVDFTEGHPVRQFLPD